MLHQKQLVCFVRNSWRNLTPSAICKSYFHDESTPSSSSENPEKAHHQETEETRTHFGYQSVTEKEKGQRVYGVFENVATKYDTMNDAMSFGIHRLWKNYFIQKLSPPSSTKLLDVAGGTGDIAFRFLSKIHMDKPSFSEVTGHVTVCDINQAMLDVGMSRAKENNITEGISWVCGNAEELPFESNSFDLYTIAFGIRNCTHVDKVIKEAYRVLKKGGRFACLEFSQVNNEMLAKVYDWYSFQVIPVMGQVIAADWDSYQYLVESIRKFPDQETFADMIEDEGFRYVDYENLLNGIVSIHSGFKL